MSIDLYRYGDVTPIYFKLTLNGVGVTGITLLSADVLVSKDGAAFNNVGSNCAEIANGAYKWTPGAASWTQCEVIIINIKATAGNIGLFDENCLIIQTGGDASARLDGV